MKACQNLKVVEHLTSRGICLQAPTGHPAEIGAPDITNLDDCLLLESTNGNYSQIWSKQGASYSREIRSFISFSQ